jgi:hypothetical protein
MPESVTEFTPIGGGRVFVLPYGKRDCRTLTELPASELQLVLGKGDVKQNLLVKDLPASDHVILFCNGKSLTDVYKPLECKVSLLMAEPFAVQARYYLLIPFFAHKFHRILTYSSALLGLLSNARFHAPFVPWVSNEIQEDKRALVSIIASKKKLTQGQRLRHQVIGSAMHARLPLSIYGRGYLEIDDKRTALGPYRFSVCIENCSEKNYYTEKILDCFAQKVVPIYWGAPNIGDFFNEEGIIACRSVSDLMVAIKTASVADYEKRALAVQDNYERVSKLPTFEQAAARRLLACA